MSKDTFTTYEISQFCGVFMTTVAKWVDEGKLPAFKTPGGHRRIKREDLIVFLTKYKMPIPDLLLEKDEKKILVVDDNPQAVEMITRALQAKNPKYLFTAAADGFEAGKQIVTFKPDVVILDVVIPGLDGLQVCENIRKDPITRDTRVIIVTGHDEPATRRDFQKLGVDDYFVKPLDLERLVGRVAEILERSTGSQKPV